MAERAGLPPPGATPDGGGVAFAVRSREADAVDLCLFEAGAGGGRERRIRLAEHSGDLFHGHVREIGPGTRYGFRVHGPYRPEEGLRFNPNKLLIDPYARAIDGRLKWDDAIFGYTRGHEGGDLSFDERDSAAYVPKAIVCGIAGGGDRAVRSRPQRPMADTVLYELHVKGYTQLHPHVPPALRGHIGALGSAAVTDHLRHLGVTAVELMPVQAWASERGLAERGLFNYWGYNPIALFAPDAAHLGIGSLDEVADTVSALHEAGIEVILDVVFNHTAEGNEVGPTIGFRGIDNRSYYLLEAPSPRWYVNFSGCGNTLKAADPLVRRLIVDCLAHWARETGVDGFRFDLAGALMRRADGRWDGDELMAAIEAEPELRGLKLIAEPWDATGDGYRLGDFPHRWSEWNDRFRTAMRRFWAGSRGVTADAATRLSGSSDVFGYSGRSPSASINYITSHDGFTLADLVSYTAKRNDANGEGNHDGSDQNHSVNCGAEGPSDDPAVRARRLRQRRNRLATLLLSRGVPMLLAGDEVGNSQGGNNNSYCQDNPTGWVTWPDGGHDDGLTDFIAGLAAIRRAYPLLTEDMFLPFPRPGGGNSGSGTTATGGLTPGYRLSWLTPQGRELEAADWHFHEAHTLICLLSSASLHRDASLLMVLNAYYRPMRCKLPQLNEDGGAGLWRRIVDTASPSGFPAEETFASGGCIEAAEDSFSLLVARAPFSLSSGT